MPKQCTQGKDGQHLQLRDPRGKITSPRKEYGTAPTPRFICDACGMQITSKQAAEALGVDEEVL